MSFKTNIILDTIQNENFRKVMFTGKKSQLVTMTIPGHSEIGEETHDFVEQTLFFLSGECSAILDDEQFVCTAGDAIVVTPGTKHNFINTGDEAVKIYTIYSPANHIDGRIHETREDAEKDVEDEAFGHSYKS